MRILPRLLMTILTVPIALVAQAQDGAAFLRDAQGLMASGSHQALLELSDAYPENTSLRRAFHVEALLRLGRIEQAREYLREQYGLGRWLGPGSYRPDGSREDDKLLGSGDNYCFWAIVLLDSRAGDWRGHAAFVQDFGSQSQNPEFSVRHMPPLDSRANMMAYALKGMAWSPALLGVPQAQWRYISEARKLAPKSLTIRIYAAALHEALGDRQKAEEELTACLAQLPPESHKEANRLYRHFLSGNRVAPGR